MDHLAGHTGCWAGTNGFRLMPDDPLQEAPLTARVAPAARGLLGELAYTWSHPRDGEQEGLLVLGAGERPGSVVAFWGDSWHQQPEPRVLTGEVVDGVLTLGYSYAGDWRWEIAVDTTSREELLVVMRNVIPASAASDTMAAGAYAAMSASLRRT